jgi:hypothetical protein
MYHGVIFLSQMAENGYMFLLGLFFKNCGEHANYDTMGRFVDFNFKP